MWGQAVGHQVSKRSVDGGSKTEICATYNEQQPLRQGLSSAGFLCLSIDYSGSLLDAYWSFNSSVFIV